jgi:hypothetical protein
MAMIAGIIVAAVIDHEIAMIVVVVIAIIVALERWKVFVPIDVADFFAMVLAVEDGLDVMAIVLEEIKLQIAAFEIKAFDIAVLDIDFDALVAVVVIIDGQVRSVANAAGDAERQTTDAKANRL